MTPKIAVPLWALILCAGLAVPRAHAAGLQVAFCPDMVARPYPLDSLRGVHGLLLQNVAIANAGKRPATLHAVEIELLKDGKVIDRRTLDAAALDLAAKAGKGAKDAGMMDMFAFQFCDGRLLGERGLAASATLAPGEAVLVMQQVFAWKGERDALRVLARTDAPGDAVATAMIHLDPATSKTVFRWPLKGGPWNVAGASFHGTHRWAIPEEFALDITQSGGDGRSFRDRGERNEDFHAYRAEVVAAASGTVRSVVTGGKELPPMLRRAGESMADYYGRIGARQVGNLAAGEAGFVGDAVVLDHDGNEYSVYAHLVPGSITVKPGDRVAAGQAIGWLGSSGNSTEPHLHFQVCDRPSVVSCAGIIPTFDAIRILNADGPRPLQTGDVVEAAE